MDRRNVRLANLLNTPEQTVTESFVADTAAAASRVVIRARHHEQPFLCARGSLGNDDERTAHVVAERPELALKPAATSARRTLLIGKSA
jgi:hypothetical protein